MAINAFNGRPINPNKKLVVKFADQKAAAAQQQQQKQPLSPRPVSALAQASEPAAGPASPPPMQQPAA